LSKRKRQRKSRFTRRPRRSRRPSAELQQALSRADSLIANGRAQEAIDLLEPLLAAFPRSPDLHYYVGFARVESGDIWGGLSGYERAFDLSRDPGYWLPLASLYLQLELNARALHAFRQVLKEQVDIPMVHAVRETVASLEQSVLATAEGLCLPAAQTERGLRFLDEGQCALQANDFPACISANQRAIKLLGDWPPPHNNLSLALFFAGQPEKAIATARQVLSYSSDNVQALSNAIRFLAWTGQGSEARKLWMQLNKVTPQGDSDRIKMAEAGAIVQDDENVYRLLKPLDTSSDAQGASLRATWKAQFFLAVAEANTGRPAARRRLRKLQENAPWAGDLLAALDAGRPGPGWADRFPYFHSSELLPRNEVDEFVELLAREDKTPPRRFRRQMSRFVARFPQVVLMAEKMIWEDGLPEGGVPILAAVATPAAHAALRRFGLSQAGEDKTRLQALFRLAQAGEISPDETLRVWSGGEWQEVQLRSYEITDEREADYSPQVADLLNEGQEAFQQDNVEKAERLFRRALKLQSRAKEACNNLGTIYAHRGEHERAKEMFQAALQIDPMYVFPRCNLASYCLDEDDVTGAEELLAPLADATRLHPQEMAFYSYTQARILLHREEYDGAQRALELALEVYPGHELVEDLLNQVRASAFFFSGFESFFEKQRERAQARRVRMQTKLSTPEPGLAEALAIYTKGSLTGMARAVLPWGGWSALRKAELLQRIIEALNDEDGFFLQRIVTGLTDEERGALRQVLARSGDMPWQEFAVKYGDDLEESPYWEYHEPETIMGRLRLRGLIVEADVDGDLLITIPSELRPMLTKILG
jgi:tetratricopeptide (TPR) repeat protein